MCARRGVSAESWRHCDLNVIRTHVSGSVLCQVSTGWGVGVAATVELPDYVRSGYWVAEDPVYYLGVAGV
jgi:hypothetical protein